VPFLARPPLVEIRDERSSMSLHVRFLSFDYLFPEFGSHRTDIDCTFPLIGLPITPAKPADTNRCAPVRTRRTTTSEGSDTT
jgi:hypothetical protein